MMVMSERFLEKLGRPDPVARPGLRFDSTEQSFWETLHAEIGAGAFLDGFLYLFGEGLERLEACLPAWAFLVPPLARPMILGMNAFGTLLVLLDRAAVNPRVGVLDPMRAVWWSPPELDFVGLVGAWLPEDQIPHFLERTPYDAWRARGGRRLAVGEMLAPSTPPALGGTLAPDALQLTDALPYFEASGAVYQATVARQRGRKRSAPRRRTRR